MSRSSAKAQPASGSSTAARGRHASELLRAGERARAQEKGLWGACPLARFDPLDSLSTGPA